MKLQIKLDNFEGPLELLIHLIEQKNINITEVKINDLINEYIIILEEAKRGNIEIKIEFLGIAIELLEIKAFSILNMREKERQEEKLIQKLTEYKLFKELSEEIRTYENEYNISHTKSDKPRQIKKIPNKKFETSNLNSESIFETYSKYIKKMRSMKLI